jgi:thiol peroxidase
MKERTGVVTSGGNPVTLVGKEIKVGDTAPNFVVLDNDMSPVEFSSFQGKIRVLSVVTSLDTSVCDIQTRRFNAEAAKLGADVEILTISMDLPYAQKRWCGAAGVDRVTVLSDHRDASFGTAYGVLVKETRLLARSVFVVDRDGIVRYVQIVKEGSNEPDYESALDAVSKLV